MAIKYIFDLDGTLALNHHREHFVTGGNKDWDSFFKACGGDLPNIPVITLLGDLVANYGMHQVMIWSGRSEDVRDITIDWLMREGPKVDFALDLDYCDWSDMLKMRPSGDTTPDQDLKLSWLQGIDKNHLVCVFDDRQKVVDMWRSQGVTCLQVAPGDF